MQDENGCRHQKWWLVDDNGHEHLAVVGDEREPRDGHYSYVAEKPFSLIRPLACQNQARVTSYLEEVPAPNVAAACSCYDCPVKMLLNAT